MTYQAALQQIERAAAENATELNLSNMSLTEVPPEIAQLVNLQKLVLMSNQISVIPNSIAYGCKLKKMVFSITW
jgi:Leucine-rich repeat (LRR) protein